MAAAAFSNGRTYHKSHRKIEIRYKRKIVQLDSFGKITKLVRIFCPRLRLFEPFIATGITVKVNDNSDLSELADTNFFISTCSQFFYYRPNERKHQKRAGVEPSCSASNPFNYSTMIPRAKKCSDKINGLLER